MLRWRELGRVAGGAAMMCRGGFCAVAVFPPRKSPTGRKPILGEGHRRMLGAIGLDENARVGVPGAGVRGAPPTCPISRGGSRSVSTTRSARAAPAGAARSRCAVVGAARALGRGAARCGAGCAAHPAAARGWRRRSWRPRCSPRSTARQAAEPRRARPGRGGDRRGSGLAALPAAPARCGYGGVCAGHRQPRRGLGDGQRRRGGRPRAGASATGWCSNGRSSTSPPASPSCPPRSAATSRCGSWTRCRRSW